MEGIRGYRYTYGLGHLGSVDCFISKLSEKSERLETPEFASNGSFSSFPVVRNRYNTCLLVILLFCIYCLGVRRVFFVIMSGMAGCLCLPCMMLVFDACPA